MVLYYQVPGLIIWGEIPNPIRWNEILSKELQAGQGRRDEDWYQPVAVASTELFEAQRMVGYNSQNGLKKRSMRRSRGRPSERQDQYIETGSEMVWHVWWNLGYETIRPTITPGRPVRLLRIWWWWLGNVGGGLIKSDGNYQLGHLLFIFEQVFCGVDVMTQVAEVPYAFCDQSHRLSKPGLATCFLTSRSHTLA